MSIKLSHTARGFSISNFLDRGGKECSIQKSSLATEDCIWLGQKHLDLSGFIPNDPTRQAHYPISLSEVRSRFPEYGDVYAFTRMDLTRKHVKELLPYLIKFAEKGELE